MDTATGKPVAIEKEKRGMWTFPNLNVGVKFSIVRGISGREHDDLWMILRGYGCLGHISEYHSSGSSSSWTRL